MALQSLTGKLTMNPDNAPNPYEAPTAPAHGSPSTLSRIAAAVGISGFILGISPTLYMCYICVVSLWMVATMELPETSIRPMGLAVAMLGLTVVGIVLTPFSLALSWIAERLGSPSGAMLAKSSMGAVAFPFLIGFVTFIAIMIICAFRGIEIGS